MIKTTVKLSSLPMALHSEREFTADFCRDYLTDDAPLFEVETTKEAVEKETHDADEPTTYEYAEALCLYREIAERLPLYDRAVFHGAAIEYGGKAYLFTAPSGTGKTTHISLWRKYLGRDVKIINGDKPILRKTEDGITVWGTPFAGKEGWQRNVSASLAGICFLAQGKDNTVTKCGGGLFIRLLEQTFRPYGKEAMQHTASLVQALCGLPCYELSCDISESAVKASFEALTGENYEEKKNENK